MRNSTPYRIRIAATADREVRRLPGHVRQRARRAIQELAHEARPSDAKELREQSGFYRLRLDGWRIVYRVDDENQVVRILCVRLKTGPETYENFG
jgi:mRNA interferase RelE/StbE